MRYSSYVKLLASLTVGLFIVFSVIFIVYFGSVGIGLTIIFGLMLAVGFGMSVAWAHRAVTEFHGSPFPGAWGILGFNLEPDHDYLASESSAGRNSDSGVAEKDRLVESQSAPGWVVRHSWTGMPPPQALPLPGPSRFACTACGTITDGSDSKFCRKCGARLVEK